MNKENNYGFYTVVAGLSAYLIYDHLNTKSKLNKLSAPITFRYKPHDSILINYNSGKMIDHTYEKYGSIYYTHKDNSNEGWRNCFLLRHELTPNINYIKEQRYVKNSIVYWSELFNITSEFDEILSHWLVHFYSRRNWPYPKKIYYWRKMVTDGSPLDIKQNSLGFKKTGEYSIYENQILRYDDYGNILFGAAGTAFGLSREVLQLGSNLNQISKLSFDDSKDTYSIDVGIKIYKERFSASLEDFNKLFINKKIA